jgi:hypothetical protein
MNLLPALFLLFVVLGGEPGGKIEPSVSAVAGADISCCNIAQPADLCPQVSLLFKAPLACQESVSDGQVGNLFQI